MHPRQTRSVRHPVETVLPTVAEDKEDIESLEDAEEEQEEQMNTGGSSSGGILMRMLRNADMERADSFENMLIRSY